MGLVICKLPKAGLGNQLFPLLKAYTFAHLNNLPVLVTNYHQIKIGPWLRGEKNKRIYNGFFIFEKNRIAAQFDKWRIRHIPSEKLIAEPEITIIDNEEYLRKSFLFNEIPHYLRRFEGLMANRQLVIQQLDYLTKSSIKKRLEKIKSPCIGVHIRMGDFKKLKNGEEFGKVGTVRTPEEYFVETIRSIRKMHGSDLPVSIFTDGSETEFSKLVQLSGVHFVKGNNDLVDLLLLSRSKILVTSGGSTFSYWAAFISDAPVLMHPAYVGIKVRPANVRDILYEGAFDEKNAQLANAIKSINMNSSQSDRESL